METVKSKIYRKIPRWVSPLEASTHPNLINFEKIIIYNSLLTQVGILKTEEQLESQGLILSWWPLLQIKSIYNQDPKSQGFEKEYSHLDKILLLTEEKQVQQLYKFLLDWEMQNEGVKDTMIQWAKMLGYTIELEHWQKFWSFKYKLSAIATHKENLLKMFYRWHLPPSTLAKMFPNLSNLCWKCKKQEGTYYHCERAKKFWIKIHTWLKQMTKQNLKFKPEICLQY